MPPRPRTRSGSPSHRRKRESAWLIADWVTPTRFVDRLFFKLILAPQLADTERQNEAVTRSELDWVIAQPVHLTDDADDSAPFLSTEGATGSLKVSRSSVGRFLAEAIETPQFVKKTVAISGARAAS